MTQITITCTRINEFKNTLSYSVEGQFGASKMKNNSKVKIDRAAMTITAPADYFDETIAAEKKAAKARSKLIRSASVITTPLQSIIMALTAAANRANLVNLAPASTKQVAYLAALLEKAGKDAAWVGCCITTRQAILTNSAASNYINNLGGK